MRCKVEGRGAFTRSFGSWRLLCATAGVAAVLGCSDDEGGKAGTGGVGGLLIVGTGAHDGGLAGENTGGASSDGGRGNGAGGKTTAGGRASGSGATSSGGATPSGGSTSTGGATSSGGTAPSSGGSSAVMGQPIGAICANDANCSQAQGMTVCCAIPGCRGPCECRLGADCPKSGLFLECKGAADCGAFGGGKVCCQAGSGSQTMQYCTKPSGCPGMVLP